MKYSYTTEEGCLQAVKDNGWNITLCKVQNDKIRKQAVDTTPNCIIYISPEYHDELLSYNPWVIWGIEQTEKRVEIALTADIGVWHSIKLWNRRIQELAISLMSKSKERCTYRINRIQLGLKLGIKEGKHISELIN